MSEGRDWQSKDILTWIILIWGFSRLANPPSPGPLGSCPINPMVQTGLQAPSWASGGQLFTMEGEQ